MLWYKKIFSNNEPAWKWLAFLFVVNPQISRFPFLMREAIRPFLAL
jgi:hypothetical protein